MFFIQCTKPIQKPTYLQDKKSVTDVHFCTCVCGFDADWPALIWIQKLMTRTKQRNIQSETFNTCVGLPGWPAFIQLKKQHKQTRCRQVALSKPHGCFFTFTKVSSCTVVSKTLHRLCVPVNELPWKRIPLDESQTRVPEISSTTDQSNHKFWDDCKTL